MNVMRWIKNMAILEDGTALVKVKLVSPGYKDFIITPEKGDIDEACELLRPENAIGISYYVNSSTRYYFYKVYYRKHYRNCTFSRIKTIRFIL